ncbi:chromate efflux transporter [Pseudarthrobacter enclensis]|uniref:chromate efflux transporter n=1 Tax=Pseudarthrobacter enclensis TaxID=993070 RepID=UPI0034260C28
MTGPTPDTARGSAGEVFRVFLKLGVTSFGGPVAHLGYFRDELVRRRAWVNDREYADLVALCQFLPGPASSQVGFGLGLHRAGPLGALAAFTAFTLPSAALLVAFALGASVFQGVIGAGILTGLKIVAVAIVAQAVWGMARTLTPDRSRAGIAVAAALLAILLAGSLGQIAAILLGALAGLVFCRQSTAALPGQMSFPVSRAVGIGCLVLFALLLFGLPLLAPAAGSPGLTLFEAFYRAGALVFGGGHVVLPLLQSGVVEPGWVTNQQFLAGYGAAQAVPGPLFTFAAYLGTASAFGPGGVAGAAVALAGIFLPGFLLLTGVLPFWDSWRSRPGAQALMRGANAAVVGILAAALYNPLFTTAITGPGPFCLGLVCFVLLTAWKAPPWAVVLVGAAGGVLLGLLG